MQLSARLETEHTVGPRQHRIVLGEGVLFGHTDAIGFAWSLMQRSVVTAEGARDNHVRFLRFLAFVDLR